MEVEWLLTITVTIVCSHTVCLFAKSSESVQCAITCVTGLQHSALYRFGRFAACFFLFMLLLSVSHLQTACGNLHLSCSWEQRQVD